MAKGSGHGGSRHAQMLRNVFDGDQGCLLVECGLGWQGATGGQYSD
jgi:hypothetical protein